MLDIIFVIATIAYFAVNALAAIGFDRLMGGSR
jgi:hypothetical protein